MASVASHSLVQLRRRQQLREFHHRTKMLLTEMEHHQLFAVVKDFQLTQHLDRFLRDLSHVLDTPTKLDLLKDLRCFVPASLAIQYDRFAPYDRMAHPLKISMKSLGRYSGRKLPSVSMQGSPASVRHPLGMIEAPASDPAPLKVITLVKDTDEQLGFSIRGGSEYGLGIFVSDVEEESAADRAGLRMGDNVIEVNSVSFENIASSSAVKVLIGCNRLRILVRRVGKVPGFKSAKEKTSWFDVVQNRIVSGTLEEHGKFHSTAAIAHVNGHVNRRVNLMCRREGEYLGFNIRGGREYALGIYVSGVDPDGIAEQKGLKVGDQIIAVNGHSFKEVTHMEAVEIMKSDKQLMMTVRDVGIYPVYKEIYAEYRWIDVITGAVTKSRTTGHITSVPVTEHSPWPTPDPPPEFQTEHTTSFIDSANFVRDEDDNIFHDSNAMELFDMRYKLPNPPSEIYASINSVLQPMKDDVIMQERHLETSVDTNGAKTNVVVKSKSPKSTIAVRAMENETRRSHPELWENEKADDSASSDKSSGHKKTGRKSRTIRELIFGTKSKGTDGKCATEGVQRKPRTRKALSGINFKLGSSKDTDSAKQGSGIEEESSFSFDTEAASKPQMDQERMENLKYSASCLLNTDEVSAVLRHLSKYREAGGVDGLVSPLTAILDTSKKASLFDEIRMILLAKDVDQFDTLMVKHRSALSAGHRSVQPLVITTANTVDVSNELCHIKRKHLQSPVATQSHVDLTAATGNPVYPHRNSKLYKAVIHDKVIHNDKVKVNEPTQEDTKLEKSVGPKMGNGRDPFGHCKLWQERIPEEPEELEDVLLSNVMNTNPPGVASVSEHQVSSVESSVCSSPVNDSVQLVRETATIESGYIDDFAMSPVYETIGAQKVQAVSLTLTPPSDNNDSGTYNSACDSRSLEEVSDALNYLDSLETEGSTGYQSNDDIDCSVPGSPRSIDSDVTTFGRRSRATYDLIAADSQSCDRVADNLGCALGDNGEYLAGDNKGNSLDDNKGVTPHLDDPRVSSPTSEGDLVSHPPPVFIPPPPPSDSPPPEDANREIRDMEGDDVRTQQDPIREATFMVMQPDIIVENVTQNSDVNDTIGDTSTSQDNDHSSDMTPVPGTLPGNGDDVSPDEGDSDTESVSTSGQFDLPDHGEVDDTDPPVTVLLDKSHRSLGISISGGSDSRSQPQVKIQKVFPGGAADIEGTIKSGMSVLSVAGHSLDDVSHHEAVTIIRRSYMDKTDPVLRVVLMKD